MEQIFEDDIENAIEEFERSAASSLLAIKVSNEKKSPKSPKSAKMTEWKSYVREVHDEISDNGRIKIPYTKAMTEASRRKRENTNKENLNKIRRDKVAKNRSKKEAETQTEIGFRPSFVQIYTYKISKNGVVVIEMVFQFEDPNVCLSRGLLRILNSFIKEVPYEFFAIPGFRRYYDDSKEDTKIFINSLIYTYFDKIFDEPYREEISIVDLDFFNKFSMNTLEFFWRLTNSIFENAGKSYKLHIIPTNLIRKIE